jgi:hypothetical protein
MSFKEGVIQGAQHRGGVKMQPCLAIEPAWLEAIRQDVRKILEQRQASDVSQKSHPTHWTMPYGGVTQHSLLNASGKTEDTSTDHDLKTDNKSFSAPECAALQRLAAAFAGHAINFRLNGLMAGSGLSPHEENVLHGDRVRLRFHLPVFTNESASAMLDGERFHLRAGYIYYFNNGCVHSASNGGTESRYHLVWDVFWDEWTEERVCDLNSPATPGEGFRKLNAAEAAELSVSEPWFIDDYINYHGERVKVKAGWPPGSSVASA